jgi:hypothetical protein
MTAGSAVALAMSMFGAVGPHGPQHPDTIVASPITRIGGATADASGFGRIEALEVDEEGTVYVLDGLEHTLTAFSPSGNRRWTVGREGQGPGEFTAPVGLAWAPDGTLWVIDPENQRVTAVTRDGALAATHMLPAGFSLSPWPGRFDRRGHFYSYLAPPDESYDYKVAVYDGNLRQVAILSPPAPLHTERFFEGTTPRGSHMRTRVPFTARHVWRIDSRGGFVSAWTGEFRFRGPSGPLHDSDGAPESGPPVSARERDAALDGLGRFVQRGGRVDEGRIPERKPVLNTFVLDPEDRVWALLAHLDGADHSRFEVLGDDGGRWTTVLAPARIEAFPTPVVREGWLVGVERDEFGRETVVLLGVEPGRLR